MRTCAGGGGATAHYMAIWGEALCCGAMGQGGPPCGGGGGGGGGSEAGAGGVVVVCRGGGLGRAFAPCRSIEQGSTQMVDPDGRTGYGARASAGGVRPLLGGKRGEVHGAGKSPGPRTAAAQLNSVAQAACQHATCKRVRSSLAGFGRGFGVVLGPAQASRQMAPGTATAVSRKPLPSLHSLGRSSTDCAAGKSASLISFFFFPVPEPLA